MELARLSLRATAADLVGPTDGARERERERWEGEGVCLYARWGGSGCGCPSKRRGVTGLLKWECGWSGKSVEGGYMSVAGRERVKG